MVIKKSVNDEAIKLAELKADEISFYSRFGFLRAVNGLRCGNLNGIIGTTGSGKSTLLKSIIADTISNSRCLVWLTEEAVEEYQPKINLVVKDKLHLRNLFFVEEKTLESHLCATPGMFLSSLRKLVELSECKVLFIDNITSSYMYSEELNIKEQGRTAMFLSRIAKELNIAVAYIAHTKKTVNDTYSGLITKEDIRGSQKISIVSEYLYILQKFQQGKSHYPIMQVCKHRFHEIEDKYFLLCYEGGNYLYDRKIDFELVRKIFKQRDVL